MSIAVACPTCAAAIEVPDPFAGKLFDCPKCGNRMLIPSITTPKPPWTAGATAQTSETPYRQVTEKPAPSSIAALGPAGLTFEVNKAVGKFLKCRACGAPVGFADEPGGTSLACPYCGAFLTVPSTSGVVKKVGRFLSLPWIALIFILGFLPWSEVSGKASDVHWRLTQSGYQNLYGGVASSSHEMQWANEKDSAEREPDREQLSKTLQAKRANPLASFSPFAVLFWTAALAFLLIALLAPLSYLRLRYCGPLAALMALMLAVQLLLGTPLERGVSEAVRQVMAKEPANAVGVGAAFPSGETVWFWLAFAAVFLTAGAECLTNLLGRNSTVSFSRISPAGVMISAAVVAAVGVGVQGLVWQVGLTRIESRLAELDRREQERIVAAKAEDERRQKELQVQREQDQKDAEQRRRIAEKAREDAENRQRELDQKQEEEEAQTRRIKETEEQERLIQAEKAREALRVQKKLEEEKAAALKKAWEEQEAAAAAEFKKKEAARKQDLELHGKPYYPLPTTVYKGKNAKEWYDFIKSPSGGREEGAKALAALKSEGLPFLLDLLDNATLEKDHSLYFSQIKAEYIHAFDLARLLPCLEKKYSPAIRLLALKDLSETKESRIYFELIAARVADLKMDRGYVKDVSHFLDLINRAK